MNAVEEKIKELTDPEDKCECADCVEIREALGRIALLAVEQREMIRKDYARVYSMAYPDAPPYPLDYWTAAHDRALIAAAQGGKP